MGFVLPSLAAAFLAVVVCSAPCGCRPRDRPSTFTVTSSDGGNEPGADTSIEPPQKQLEQCVHQRRADLEAPAHLERGGKGGFIRLSECTRVFIIESDDRWARVAFPLTDGRTEGWMSLQYLMACQPCEVDASPTASDPARLPQPEGMCRDAGATGQESFLAVGAQDVAEAGGGARGAPGVEVTLLSYNLWELYDGLGGDTYLSPEHGASPAQQYRNRLQLFSRFLGRLTADVLLLQEVEGAEVACSLARMAWPDSSWSCSSTKRGGARARQNVAIATRLKGESRVLRPVLNHRSGPRGALELSLEGAGGLTVTTVHLKSSRGLRAHADCDNARQRMGAAAALSGRYRGWSSVLIAGDFNVDPSDTGRAIYDRTDDVLTASGFERLCQSAGCETATYLQNQGRSGKEGSAIDLAFFRGGGVWKVHEFEVISSAPHRSRNPLGSDHLPIRIELYREP